MRRNGVMIGSRYKGAAMWNCAKNAGTVWRRFLCGAMFGLFAVLWLLPAGTVQAAWRMDARGYYWENSDGSYPVSVWAWLDGNEDGIAECYYFDENGYMLRGTKAPDGSDVNADGAWTVGGVVQTRSTGLLRDADGSVQISIGSIELLPAEEFTRVEPQENGYLLENASGSRMATVMEVDLDRDESLKAVLDMGSKMGLSFDSPEMSRILTNAFVSSFSGKYGEPDSVTDLSYPSGSWKRLHYASLQSGAHTVQTDIYLHYADRKAYSIIFAALDGQIDTDRYMQNYVK